MDPLQEQLNALMTQIDAIASLLVQSNRIKEASLTADVKRNGVQELQQESVLKLLLDIKKAGGTSDAILKLLGEFEKNHGSVVAALESVKTALSKEQEKGTTKLSADLGKVNKTLLELLKEVKKKEQSAYDIEITPELFKKLKGQDGLTPKKGTDYFTKDEQELLIKAAVSSVLKQIKLPQAIKQEINPVMIVEIIKNIPADKKLKPKDLGITIPPDFTKEIQAMTAAIQSLRSTFRGAGRVIDMLDVNNNTAALNSGLLYKLQFSPVSAKFSFVEDTGGGGDLSLYQLRSEKNQANGYVGLGSDSKINSAYLPAIAVTNTFVVGSEAAMLALTAETGDIAVRTDITKTFILQGTDPAVLADWIELQFPTDAVSSVFGRSGVVTAQSGDYDADQITETATRVFVTPAEKAKLATVGEEVSLQVYAIENILKGQVVGIGAVVSGTKQSAYLVDANTRAGGIAAEDIAINTEGKVIIEGLLTGIDTSAFTGSAWVSDTVLGGMTNSTPAGPSNRSQPVGEYIESDAVNGVMYVNIQAPERRAGEIYAQTATGDTNVQSAITELETSIQNNLLDVFRPSDVAAYNPNNFDDINPNTSSNDFYGMLLGIDNAFGKTRGKMRVPVGAHVSAGQNGTATTTLAPGANNFKLMPFVPYFDFECDQLVANVSALFAGSNFKFVIYEMVNFRSGSQETGDITDAVLVYESGNISGATTGLKTDAVSIQFFSGVTYLIGIRTSSGTLAFTSIPLGSLPNMIGHSTVPATNMFTNEQKTLAFATPADTNPTSFVGINSAFPLIMMRVGSHL